MDVVSLHRAQRIRVAEDGQFLFSLIRVAAVIAQTIIGEPRMTHDLGCSGTKRLEHLPLGIEARLWAVEVLADDSGWRHCGLVWPGGIVGRSPADRQLT